MCATAPCAALPKGPRVRISSEQFFTVILFKQLYSRLVLAAGFTVRGREWIANGFVSTLLGVLTFEVYANMTRFQWACE